MRWTSCNVFVPNVAILPGMCMENNYAGHMDITFVQLFHITFLSFIKPICRKFSFFTIFLHNQSIFFPTTRIIFYKVSQGDLMLHKFYTTCSYNVSICRQSFHRMHSSEGIFHSIRWTHFNVSIQICMTTPPIYSITFGGFGQITWNI